MAALGWGMGSPVCSHRLGGSKLASLCAGEAEVVVAEDEDEAAPFEISSDCCRSSRTVGDFRAPVRMSNATGADG